MSQAISTILRSHPRYLLVALAVWLISTSGGTARAAASNGPAERVQLTRVPDGGIQPQVAVGDDGVIHLIYYKGEAKQGDIYYVRSSDGGATFSKPLRVNSQPESAIAAGTIRGAELALGAGGRVHVAWNGSIAARPKGPLNPEQEPGSPYNGQPMLYARLNDKGTAFEPQRGLMQKTFGLDGGGAIAADTQGNVYVLWHGKTAGDPAGESGRRVWIARSADNGKTFAAEESAYAKPTGACGCCGMRAFTDAGGNLYVMFRSAQQEIHRDEYLLRSRDHGRSFEARVLHPWQINACPMTSATMASDAGDVLAGWETEGQVYFSRIAPEKLAAGAAPLPWKAGGRKYPSLAVNAGETLLAWTQVGGWGKGGALRWQLLQPRRQSVDTRRVRRRSAIQFRNSVREAGRRFFGPLLRLAEIGVEIDCLGGRSMLTPLRVPPLHLRRQIVPRPPGIRQNRQRRVFLRRRWEHAAVHHPHVLHLVHVAVLVERRALRVAPMRQVPCSWMALPNWSMSPRL